VVTGCAWTWIRLLTGGLRSPMNESPSVRLSALAD
jgi:hypothetical protein